MRRRSFLPWMVLSLALVLADVQARADTYTFSLIPASGDVAGSVGSTVGWGYSITNDSAADWLVTTALASDPFQNGTPTQIFDFPDLAPGATVTLPFSLDATASCSSPPCGLYELSWDAAAPVGFVNLGTFTLGAQWWTGDPLNGGTLIMDAPDASAPYSATATAAAPEPSMALLLLAVLAGVAFGVRKRVWS